MQKDKVKSIIYNIKGKPNFNGYRGTLYESKYKKYFLYNGAEKAFRENEDNKMILDTENNKLYINGSEFTEPSFTQYDVDKPIQDGLICWLDGYDKNENVSENLWRSRVGNIHGLLNGSIDNMSNGWLADGGFKLNGIDNTIHINADKNIYQNGFTLSIYFDKYLRRSDTFNRLLNYSGSASGLAIDRGHSDRVKLVINNIEHWMLVDTDNSYILSITKMSNVTKIYLNGFYIFECTADFSNFINDLFIGGTNQNANCADVAIKSFLLYDRALTPEEVKHNYIYERYYRDKQKEINLNIRPLVQEIGINEGISIANDSHKEITVNSDGTFSNSDNTISGQKVRHIVTRRKICNRNTAKQSEFMLNKDNRMNISYTKITDTSYRLVKKLTGSEQHLHGYFRQYTPKQSSYTASFYVVKMTGDWSFGSINQIVPNISLGWNKITLDTNASKVIGFYCNNSCLEGELIFEHYKCEEGSIFTGMNDTEYDLYEEEYVEGLYKGKNTTNLATEGSCGVYSGRGYTFSDKTYKNGWWEVTINGSDEGIGPIPYLYLSKPSLGVGEHSFSAYIDSCGYDTTNKVRVDGFLGLGNVNLDKCGKFTFTGNITEAGTYGIHIVLRGVLTNQKFRWKDDIIQTGAYSPYVSTYRGHTKQIYTMPNISGITVDLFSLYMEIYSPHKFSAVTDTKPLFVNGNHLPEDASNTVPNITEHSAYSIRNSAEIESIFAVGHNILLIHKRCVYLNGVKTSYIMQEQTNYNTNLISFNTTGYNTTKQSLNGISVISELYKSSDLAHLTEQDCINISKYGLKRYNANKLIPMREVEKL